MISLEKAPFSDTDAATIREWISHPGRLLYQQFLAAQAAECMVEAENIRVLDEEFHDLQNSQRPAADAATLQAKVLRAANKKLEEVIAKDYQFYTVVLKPEPALKNET